MAQVTKHLWEELTKDQRNEFRAMMKFAGWRDEAQYKYNAYQLDEAGKPHGWIDHYRSQLIKNRSKVKLS